MVDVTAKEDFDIAMTKTLESEVLAMCNLSKGVEERGIAIGLERGIETTSDSSHVILCGR